MGRRKVPHDEKRAMKRAIASRLQRVIDEQFGTFSAFDKAMRRQGRAALASTVHNWLPPQERWKAKPDGAAVKGIDWDSVHQPSLARLREFCEVLNVSLDWLLFAKEDEKSPVYRGESRSTADLEKDLAVRVARGVHERARVVSLPPLPSAGLTPSKERDRFVAWAEEAIIPENIDASAVLDDAVGRVMEEGIRVYRADLRSEEVGVLQSALMKAIQHLPDTDTELRESLEVPAWAMVSLDTVKLRLLRGTTGLTGSALRIRKRFPLFEADRAMQRAVAPLRTRLAEEAVAEETRRKVAAAPKRARKERRPR